MTLAAATTVTATFNLIQETLSVSFRAIGAGQGSAVITSTPAGISCKGPVCTTTASFNEGQVVTLTVSGIASASLGAWTPSTCSGTTCAVTMSAGTSVSYTGTSNNIIFVTQNGTTGNIGGLAGADAMCQTSAVAAGLPGTYVAWLASATGNAATRLGSAQGWIRPDGLPFANTLGTSGGKTGLVNGQVYFPPNIDEYGTVHNVTVWAAAQTGLDAATGSSPSDCAGWTSSASTIGLYGTSSDGSRDWAPTFYGQGCSTSASIYCMGTNLTTAVTPATTTGRYAFISSSFFTPSSGLAAADGICSTEATNAGLATPSNYKAFLASNGTTAASRFSLTGANWIRTDGLPIASSIANLLAGTLLVPITTHADGTYVVYATGSAYNFTGAATPTTAGTMATTCNNWSSAVTGLDGYVGQAPTTDTNFFGSWSGNPCANVETVYCFSL